MITEPKPVVIEEALLRRLRAGCETLAEDLEAVRQAVWSGIRDEQHRAVAPCDYSLSFNVTARLNNGKWDATCDHEHWVRGKPDKTAAIDAALKAELKRVLKNLEDRT